MYYIDSHVHLNDETLLNHLDEVINEALKEGVKKFFVVGWDKESSLKAIKLSEMYPNTYAIIGFHPCNVRGLTEEDYKWLDEACTNSLVIAIGEIGFDFHWDSTTKEEQLTAFHRQLEIASKHHLPVSIHSRDAIQLTYDELAKSTQRTGVIHSYSGSKEMAKEFVKLGFVLGISGPVTFKNGRNAKEVCEEIDLEYLISETDSPYLTPHPFRGKENGPKYIPLIVDEIAKLKNVSKEIVKQKIIENVERVFKV